LLLPPVQKLSM